MQNLIERKLESCEGFADIFELVKMAVRKVLGRSRAGLSLIIADLSKKVVAFHEIGANAIILNRKYLSAARKLFNPQEFKAFIFVTLLHEYLHSLGIVDEYEVKETVQRILTNVFSSDHPVMRVSKLDIDNMEILVEDEGSSNEIEIVKDFDSSSQSYIA